MLNHIDIMGRICNDLELKRTNSDVPVVSFRLAVDRDRTSSGEEKKADFFPCTAWRHNAEFVSKYFGKGRMIAISGHIQNKSWVDTDGNNRTSTEIIADRVYFADSKRDAASGGATGQVEAPEETFDGDLPF